MWCYSRGSWDSLHKLGQRPSFTIHQWIWFDPYLGCGLVLFCFITEIKWPINITYCETTGGTEYHWSTSDSFFFVCLFLIISFDILNNHPLKCKNPEYYYELSTSILNETKIKQGRLANEEHSQQGMNRFIRTSFLRNTVEVKALCNLWCIITHVNYDMPSVISNQVFYSDYIWAVALW